MAGLGYKGFASGEVLTAANFQGYAVDQSVMKFATTAARTTALAAPNQGMVSWIDATGSLEAYYELYNASTNPGGAAAAGWYPLPGQAYCYADATRTSGASGTTYLIGDTNFAMTEISDKYSWHDATTNPTRITPNFAGMYQITATGLFGGGSTTNWRRIRILLNGTVFAADTVNATYAQAATCTAVAKLNGSTDYFTADYYQDSAGTSTVTARLAVTYLGPSIS